LLALQKDILPLFSELKNMPDMQETSRAAMLFAYNLVLLPCPTFQPGNWRTPNPSHYILGLILLMQFKT
jgi:hypothetical protein